MECCDMRGYLSFLVLWVLRRKAMTGSEIAAELEKRKGHRPSPGTIYPALKELKEKGLIASDKGKKYSLTIKGEKELRSACSVFCHTFHDMGEMAKCCKK